MSLNRSPVYQDTLQCSNEWNIFEEQKFTFQSPEYYQLSEIEEFRFIAKSTNAAVIGICESKFDILVLEQQISIDNYKILRCDRNRHGGAAACYVRNDLNYSICFAQRNVSFEIIPLKFYCLTSKPITGGTSYAPSSQTNFL